MTDDMTFDFEKESAEFFNWPSCVKPCAVALVTFEGYSKQPEFIDFIDNGLMSRSIYHYELTNNTKFLSNLEESIEIMSRRACILALFISCTALIHGPLLGKTATDSRRRLKQLLKTIKCTAAYLYRMPPGG